MENAETLDMKTMLLCMALFGSGGKLSPLGDIAVNQVFVNGEDITNGTYTE